MRDLLQTLPFCTAHCTLKKSLASPSITTSAWKCNILSLRNANRDDEHFHSFRSTWKKWEMKTKREKVLLQQFPANLNGIFYRSNCIRCMFSMPSGMNTNRVVRSREYLIYFFYIFRFALSLSLSFFVRFEISIGFADSWNLCPSRDIFRSMLTIVILLVLMVGWLVVPINCTYEFYDIDEQTLYWYHRESLMIWRASDSKKKKKSKTFGMRRYRSFVGLRWNLEHFPLYCCIKSTNKLTLFLYFVLSFQLFICPGYLRVFVYLVAVVLFIFHPLSTKQMNALPSPLLFSVLNLFLEMNFIQKMENLNV